MMDAQDLRQAVGERVRDYRRSNRYTQANFAKKIDISMNFLSEIENGRKGMSQETLYKLCEQFGLSADYILFGKDAPESRASGNEEKPALSISGRVQTMDNTELNTLIDFLVSLREVRGLSL